MRIFILTDGCFVNQCLKTFKTLIVEAVLTIAYSLARCSLEIDARGLPEIDCGDDILPPNVIYHLYIKRYVNKNVLPGVLDILSLRTILGDSPDVATANACVAAAELIRRRDDRDEVTTTPGRTF